VTGAIVVREGISVGEFAVLLGQKPFKIIADLMEIGVFASLKQVVNFETMRRLARKYGCEAKRQA
jgi:translation initiation factor IF-2